MEREKTSEESSDCEEKEIKTKHKHKENKEVIDNQIKNFDLIKSVSQTLTAIIQNSKKMKNYKEIVKKQSKVVFSASSAPEISLEDYLIRIQTY